MLNAPLARRGLSYQHEASGETKRPATWVGSRLKIQAINSAPIAFEPPIVDL
jgi:hypothetical protein